MSDTRGLWRLESWVGNKITTINLNNNHTRLGFTHSRQGLMSCDGYRDYATSNGCRLLKLGH